MRKIIHFFLILWQHASSTWTPDGNLNIVEFTYSNSPRVSVQHRSQAHDGACSLEVIEKPEKKLIGKYWTERITKGEMDFKFLSKEMRQEFS